MWETNDTRPQSTQGLKNAFVIHFDSMFIISHWLYVITFQLECFQKGREFAIQWKWPWDNKSWSFSVHPTSGQLDLLQTGGLINSNLKLNYDANQRNFYGPEQG